MIVKEELDRVMILQEGKQYKKIYGRIDEGLIGDLAKKYGVQKRIVSAILAASIAAGAVAPKTAEAGKFFQKQGPDVEQQVQVEDSVYDEITPELKSTGAGGMKVFDAPDGPLLVLFYANANGEMPSESVPTPDGPKYKYPGSEVLHQSHSIERQLHPDSTVAKMGYSSVSVVNPKINP